MSGYSFMHLVEQLRSVQLLYRCRNRSPTAPGASKVNLFLRCEVHAGEVHRLQGFIKTHGPCLCATALSDIQLASRPLPCSLHYPTARHVLP